MLGITNSISSVSRAALANDALFSPVKLISGDYTLLPEDIGKTLITYSPPAGTEKITITIPNSTFAQGVEFAVMAYANNVTVEIAHASNVYMGCSEWGNVYNSTSRKVKISRRLGMAAIKKVFSTAYWIVSGEIEDAST